MRVRNERTRLGARIGRLIGSRQRRLHENGREHDDCELLHVLCLPTAKAKPEYISDNARKCRPDTNSGIELMNGSQIPKNPHSRRKWCANQTKQSVAVIATNVGRPLRRFANASRILHNHSVVLYQPDFRLAKEHPNDDLQIRRGLFNVAGSRRSHRLQWPRSRPRSKSRRRASRPTARRATL